MIRTKLIYQVNIQLKEDRTDRIILIPFHLLMSRPLELFYPTSSTFKLMKIYIRQSRLTPIPSSPPSLEVLLVAVVLILIDTTSTYSSLAPKRARSTSARKLTRGSTWRPIKVLLFVCADKCCRVLRRVRATMWDNTINFIAHCRFYLNSEDSNRLHSILKFIPHNFTPH